MANKDAGNCRPISLLSVCLKIINGVMHVKLIKYLNIKIILHDSQYGFRAGHSCKLVLFETQNNIKNKNQISRIKIKYFISAHTKINKNNMIGSLMTCITKSLFQYTI